MVFLFINLFIYLSYSKYSDFVDNQQTTKTLPSVMNNQVSTVPNVQTKKRVSNILTYDIILVNISSSLQHRINAELATDATLTDATLTARSLLKRFCRTRTDSSKLFVRFPYHYSFNFGLRSV